MLGDTLQHQKSPWGHFVFFGKIVQQNVFGNAYFYSVLNFETPFMLHQPFLLKTQYCPVHRDVIYILYVIGYPVEGQVRRLEDQVDT